jgi:ribosomal protein L4
VFAAGKFSVVDKVAVEASIKDANKILESFNSPKKVTIVTENVEQNVLKAFSNIQNVRIMFVGEVSVYDLLNSGHLIIEEAALNNLKERSL